MIRVPISEFPVGQYNVFVYATITFEAGLSPVQPHRPHVTFTKDPKMPLPNVIGTLTIAPSVPADLVTGRMASVVLNTATPLFVDLTTGTGTFPCLVGDAYSITDVDTNVTGASLPSIALVGTVSVPVVGTVPTTPTGLAVTFAAAP